MTSYLSAPSRVAVFPSQMPREKQGEIELVGSSTAMQRLRVQVRRIGPHFRSVLVSGEAGTGKKFVARALHHMRRGASGPLVVCPATELENGLVCRSEKTFAESFARLTKLFGPGTLFLDGVDEMSLRAQDRLIFALKSLEQTQSEDSPQRIIASTREDLKALVSAGRFRQELYLQLATVEIALPPLRDRIDDLAELVEYFLERCKDGHAYQVADEAMKKMQQYRWPENMRELNRVLRDATGRCKGQLIEPGDLPELAHERGTVNETATMRLQDVVDQYVLRVLKDCGGNKLRAAEILGISRSTLYRMLDAGACSEVWTGAKKPTLPVQKRTA
ncbi:MAG TPA: sigma 54-interacting transcriptional regulator [Edaphobacter sp.]|jgi:DNA-binding NtrC family response regulator|nr:sigma 54-interacting transcriptional regulator [Edaphobacter sp.]